MKFLSNVTIAKCAVMLVGAIALTACGNKEDDHAKKMTDLGITAANEFCGCWEQFNGDLMAQLENCAGGLYVKYGAHIEDEQFYAAFGEQITVCQSEVDWDAIFCLLSFAECPPELEELFEKADVAAMAFCNCWGENEDNPMQMMICAGGLQPYMADFADERFQARFGLTLSYCEHDVDFDALLELFESMMGGGY